MKKVLSIVLSIVMVLCMMPAMAFASTDGYTDIAGTACEDAVNALSDLGVINGYPDGTYKPEGTVTRAEAAKLIVSALGLADQAAGSTASFTDLAGYDWAEGYIGYAEALGVLKGDGNGKYRPGDTVSYNEFATIVVRALGYTDESLPGTWPANYVSKAKTLGVLADITGAGGANGSNRGDCAIMLNNALELPIGTVNKDAQWVRNTPADTMLNRLETRGIPTDAAIITKSDADAAESNIYDYVGAYASAYLNEDGDIVAIKEVKSTFLTGKFTNGLTKFDVDGTKYTVAQLAYDTVNASGAAITTAPALLDNLVTTATPVTDGAVYTIAANVSGKTIKDVYSVAKWTAHTEQIEASDLTLLEKKNVLFSPYTFALDYNEEIDTNKFALEGVDSLDEIKVDDVVSVYATSGNQIVKVAVTDKVVTGKLAKVAVASAGAVATTDKYTVDGTAYKPYATSAAIDTCAAGDEVTITLTPDGKIFKLENAVKALNYAIVMNVQSETSATAGTISGTNVAKVQLFTEAGEATYDVDTKKVASFKGDVTSLIGNLVKYTVKDDKVVAIETVTANIATNSAIKITKAGYLDGKEISDNAVVFTAANAITAPSGTSIHVANSSGAAVVKKADLGLSSKSVLLGADVAAGDIAYVTNAKGDIVAMVIPSTVSTDATVYGILNATYESATHEGTAVDLIIGSAVSEDLELDANNSTTSYGALVVIKTNADGSVTLEDTSDATMAYSSISAINYITVSGQKINNDGTIVGTLASDAIVYVWNAETGVYEVGTTADINTTNTSVAVSLYTCKTASHDDYELIKFVIVK